MNLFKNAVATGIVILSAGVAPALASAASYTATDNDTLYSIAQSHGVSLEALENANPQLSNFSDIWAGLQINIPDSNSAQFPRQVAKLVNQQRANAGLQPLTFDSDLSVMAADKTVDMYDYHYFDHNSPHYGSPFDMMDKYGIYYSYAGENIAQGQSSPQEVMKDWMNSTGHRQNILNPNFTKIGVAFYNGEWVQEFTG